MKMLETNLPHDTPISQLGLSVRTSNCIANNIEGINTVGDLIKKSHSELLRIGNFGRKSLNELEMVLNAPPEIYNNEDCLTEAAYVAYGAIQAMIPSNQHLIPIRDMLAKALGITV